VNFYIDTNTHSDGWFPETNLLYTVPTVVADRYTAVGDWQNEAGESGDWKNDSVIHVMKDDGSEAGDSTAGDGIYVLNAVISTPGTYAYKVILNGTWDRQIRADGPNGSGFDTNGKVNFTTEAFNQAVRLMLDINLNRIKAEVLPVSGVAEWPRM